MHSLLQSQDARARPSAQEVANLLWSLARLQHSPKDSRLLDDFCMYMHSLLQSQDARACPNAQEVANLVWSLARLQHSPKNSRLLDDFCMYMHSLLQSQDARARPTAQEVANTLWALARVKHAPPSEAVSASLDHMVALCQTPGLQPKAQAVSNCFLACAELSLKMRPGEVEVLFKHLPRMQASRGDLQHYCNVAWSLAVMGRLDLRMFHALLHQLTSKDKLLMGELAATSESVQLTVEEAGQLHHALEFLKPAPGSQQMEAWSSLHSRLQAVAPAPHHVPQYFPGHTDLYDALATLRLVHKPMIPCGTYQADAVLFSHDSSGARVILMLHRSKYLITNVRSRLLGHVAFRLRMLGRYGTVVTVPYYPGKSNVESMPGAIMAAVEAKTGLPLDSFRR